jgi:hypothetical protein
MSAGNSSWLVRSQVATYHGGTNAAVGRKSILSDQQRDRKCEALRETLEQTSDNKCNIVLGGSLNRDTDSTADKTDPDRELASIAIRHPGGHGVADGATQRVDGVDEPKPDPRWTVHELPPLRQSKKPVHQGTVETVGAGEEHQRDDADVRLNEMALLPPGDTIFWQYSVELIVGRARVLGDLGILSDTHNRRGYVVRPGGLTKPCGVIKCSPEVLAKMRGPAQLCEKREESL